MRLAPWVIGGTEQALREIMRFAGPADVTLSRYFREHPKLGSRERSAIAEAVYGFLRHRLVLMHFSESGHGPQLRRIALLALAESSGLEALGGVEENERLWLTHVLSIDRATLSLALRSNFPDWIRNRLIDQFGQDQAEQLMAALNQPASLDVRINTIQSSAEQVESALMEAGIQFERARYAPHALRLLAKPALQNLPVFKQGAIEVQDEGSQLLAHLLGARRGEMVVDFCAGAGGKTLAIGAMMRNTGRLYAFDISDKRLAKLKPRLARSGLYNVHPVLLAHENDAKVKRLAGKVDRVLVDAPCSGFGTLRRNPDIKWRQQPDDVTELCERQSSILNSAARLPKVGGRLVYATCSLLMEENQAIIERFLSQQANYRLIPAHEILLEQKIALDTGDYLQLLPHRHGTDGFFAAVLERSS
ncbi:MAG: RsmB/NOP family class I SAM-dependent RNA methyltransferase [Betaproteobacteria bacterium]|nr:RsmB/NOP family class I SAM-dependent RNA methyltransferase [Betaproteobacteria bacterium]